MPEKPRGFNKFDLLMRKLVKLPASAGKKSVAQINVLNRLMSGWILDRHGKDGMQGIMVRGRKEVAVVSAKTMNSLLSNGFIKPSSVPSVTEFEITTHGKAELK